MRKSTDISKFSKEELLAELEKRNQESKEESKENILCIGILDIDGTESLIKVNSSEHFNATLSSLKLRARFNSHRKPIVYSVKIPLSLFNIMDESLQKGKYHEVSVSLQELSTFEEL